MSVTASSLREQAPRNAADIIEKLRRMPTADIRRDWVSFMDGLRADDASEVIRVVGQLTGITTSALKATARAERAEAEARERLRQHEKALAGRREIRYHPESKTFIARQLEAEIIANAAPGTYVSFGGALAEVATKALPYTHLVDADDEAPPTVPQMSPLDEVAIISRIEGQVVLMKSSRDGWTPMGVPKAIVDIVLKKRDHAAPRVTGLVTHPVVLPTTGEILARDGLHESGLFLAGAAIDDAVPYTGDEAVRALTRIRTAFLEGFEFASPMDSDIALAGLFTGVLRRVLDMAPGLAVIASTQSSGKTTLARRLHITLTGQDMPVSAFPDGDEAEMQKRLLSMLMRSPAMVCFDNIMDGTAFRSASIAAAMTGPVLTQRMLGHSRDAECPTNVMFVITGNNLSLGGDEVTRWLVARLAPTAPNPEQRHFKHPDVVGYALRQRDAILRDVVGVVAGYLRSDASMPTRTRFPTWDRMVRQSLIWAGAGDMALAFDANAQHSDEVQAHMALVSALYDVFGNTEFYARDVVKAIEGRLVPGVFQDWDVKPSEAESRRDAKDVELRERLCSALEDLRAKDARSQRSVGRVLKAKVNRATFLDDDEHRSAKLVSRRAGGLWLFQVQVMG